MWNPFKKKSVLLIPDYNSLVSSCLFDSNYDIITSGVCLKILLNIERYSAVELATKVPWYLIAALHYRESDLDFNTCLHNGDKLPGPTHNVPAGRGPFKSWEDAAIDALVMEKLPIQWTIQSCLEFSEKYNGLGYRSHGCYSPYVWAGTSVYTGGLYIADDKFSSSKFDKRIGTACIIKKLTSAF
jgi:lysozyme family protein